LWLIVAKESARYGVGDAPVAASIALPAASLTLVHCFVRSFLRRVSSILSRVLGLLGHGIDRCGGSGRGFFGLFLGFIDFSFQPRPWPLSVLVSTVCLASSAFSLMVFGSLVVTRGERERD
jgi:hypothetical protein